MFLKEIVESDPFVTMPPAAQALYFHLCMNCDDDGFLNSPVKIQREMGAESEDLAILIQKRFVLAFDNGVIVIKHWRMQNTLRKDRYTPTQYQDLFHLLTIKENGAYTEAGNRAATKRQPSVTRAVPQASEVKVGQEETTAVDNNHPTYEEVLAFASARKSIVDPKRFYEWYTNTGWKDMNGKPINWRNTFLNWERQDKKTREKEENGTDNIFLEMMEEERGQK